MKRLVFLLAFLLPASRAFSDACIFTGDYVKCLASGGIWIDQGKELRLGTGTANANYVGLKGSGTGSYTLTFPTGLPGATSVLETNTGGTLSWVSASGFGDVVGPSSSTDNAVVRFDGTTGKLVQDSGVIVSDTNQISAPGGTNSEKFGSGVIASGTSDAVFGKNASSTGSNNTIVGYNSKIASGAGNVLVGDGLDFSGATTLAAQLTAVGSQMSVGSVTQANGTTLVGYGITATSTNIGLATAVGANISIGGQATSMGAAGAASSTGASNYGYNSQATGLSTLAVAANSTASATNATAVGESSTANGVNATAIGESATAGLFGTAIGQGTSAVANSGTAIGFQSSAGNNGALGINGITTAGNQLVIGGSFSPTNDLSTAFIGNGVTNTSPSNMTINATGGSGSNVAGASLTLAGGRSTGSAAGGAVIFQSTAASGSSSTLNSLVEIGRFSTAGLTMPGSSSGSTVVKASAAASGTLTLPAATDTLVGKATTDTLTNKTLSGNTATNLISGSGTLTLNTTGTITVPNATDTLVGKATTDTLTNKSISGSTNTITNISLTTGVTGVLPIANGGSNKALTLASGGLIWGDSDSFEMGAAGTASDWALSGGTGAPTFSSTTTTAKVIDGSADAVQLTVEGNATQTSDILDVRKSDGTTMLLQTTNVNGTKIRGTTTNDNAAAGFVGEIISTTFAAANAGSTGQFADMGNVSLTAGDWDVSYVVESTANGATITGGNWSMAVTSTSGNSTTGMTTGDNRIDVQVPTVSADVPGTIPGIRVSISGTTTYYAKTKITYSVGTPTFSGRLSARRVR